MIPDFRGHSERLSSLILRYTLLLEQRRLTREIGWANSVRRMFLPLGVSIHIPGLWRRHPTDYVRVRDDQVELDSVNEGTTIRDYVSGRKNGTERWSCRTAIVDAS